MVHMVTVVPQSLRARIVLKGQASEEDGASKSDREAASPKDGTEIIMYSSSLL